MGTNGSRRAPDTTPNTTNPTPKPVSPEITLHIPSVADRETIKNLPYETTIQKIKESTCATGKEIVAVQRLRSGDLRLYTSSARARDALRDDST